MSDFSKVLFTHREGDQPTEDQLARWGCYADRMPFSGMPAYESEHGKLVVMENVVVHVTGPTHAPMVFPLSYRSTSVRAPDGLAALHDDPDAVWSWRPLLYTLGLVDYRLGSQQELAYRVGLSEAAAVGDERTERMAMIGLRMIQEEHAVRGRRLRKNARKRLARRWREAAAAIHAEPYPSLPSVVAAERAEQLLRALLQPQQRLDLAAGGGFYVPGRINRMYEVRPGEGFNAVDPVTREETISFCLHPEEFVPHADVALATKLGIEAGEEIEAELLEAANPTLLHKTLSPTREHRAAYRLARRYELDR